MKLKIEDLTVESFAPFGEVITQPARGQDAQGPGGLAGDLRGGGMA